VLRAMLSEAAVVLQDAAIGVSGARASRIWSVNRNRTVEGGRGSRNALPFGATRVR
jgi:hypothetical protein